MIDMKSDRTLASGANRAPDPLAASIAAIELELALDFQKAEHSFRRGVEWAAASIGGEVLFEMPAEGQVENASKLCAVRVPSRGSPGPHTILFVRLAKDGKSVRVAEGREIGARLEGFAKAYASLMDRLRRTKDIVGNA